MTYDGSYTVVTFTANSSFNVTGTITNATVLVVAGGGGGSEGGAGAGGLIYNTTMADLTVNYTVVVGAGGAHGHPSSTAGTAGQNSSFGTFASLRAGG